MNVKREHYQRIQSFTPSPELDAEAACDECAMGLPMSWGSQGYFGILVPLSAHLSL